VADFRHDSESGQTFIFEPDNQEWREATPMEVRIGQSGAVGQALSAVEGATGVPGIINSELGDALGAVNSTSENVGLVGSLFGGAGVAKGGKLIERVMARKAASEATQQTAERAAGGVFKTDSGFTRLPSDMVPAPLAGTVRAVEAGISAIPGARVGMDMINIQRQRVLAQKVGQTIGVNADDLAAGGGKLTPDVIDASLSRVDAAYDDARGLMNDVGDPGSLQRIVDQAVDAKVLDADLAKDYAQVPVGDALLDIRSTLRANKNQADNIVQSQKMDKIITNIQKIIDDAAEGTDIKPRLDEADRIWRNWAGLRDSAAIRDDGTINFPSLRNALSKNFGARKVKGGGKMTGDVEQELIDAVTDYGTKLGKPIPSSGTAERGAAAALLAGGVGGGIF
jgi:hypothetical protein